MDTIYITAADNARLRLLLLLSPYTDARQRERELLRRELDRAAILPSSGERPEVIGLGVAFEFVDLETGAVQTGCLCLPDDVASTPYGISVLSRFGAAVIGCGVGSEVWWAEADRSRRILVRRLCADGCEVSGGEASEPGANPIGSSSSGAQAGSERELQPAL